MKKCLIICALILTAGIIWQTDSLSAPAAKAKDPNADARAALAVNPNTVLVTINGDDINEGQLLKIIRPDLEASISSLGPRLYQTAIDNLKSLTLNDLIPDTVIKQLIRDNKITVTDTEVDDYVKTVLSTTYPPMTFEQLKNQIVQEGGTYESWKVDLDFKHGLRMRKLIEKIYPEQMKIPEDEVKKQYQTYQSYFNKPEFIKARHILIDYLKDEPNSEQRKVAAKKLSEDIIDKIRKGADFNEMAKLYSKDEMSAKKGGDLGYFDVNRMVPEFSKAAFSLRVGQVSDPVETQFGFHIIRVDEHLPPTTIPYEKARLVIINGLVNQKLQTLGSQYFQKAISDAKVVYPPGSTIRAYRPDAKTMIQGGVKPTVPLPSGAGTAKPPTPAPKPK